MISDSIPPANTQQDLPSNAKSLQILTHSTVGHTATLFTPQGWLILTLFALVFILLLPALNFYLPDSSPLHLSDYMIGLIGKIMCYAVVALAMGFVWGYVGVLSLGHGLFFALGGYAMGMYLMRSIGSDGVYGNPLLPDFMVFLDWKELPWYWLGFDHFWFAMLMVVLVPGILAFVFGYFAFRSRIKGVYFSIITQAMTFAFMLLFFRNETGFGGNNGFTDFKRILGYSLSAQSTRLALFISTAVFLIIALLMCRFIVISKLGRVLTAIRDAESRLMFSGYNPLGFKLFAWTFSAMLCGVAGALYVPQAGIINPGEMSPANSIEIAIWVAVGGRGSLLGPLIGAGLINGAKSWLTVAFPSIWLYVLGLMFILVTLFMPKGITGLYDQLKRGRRRASENAQISAPVQDAAALTLASPAPGQVIP